jgi:hypothetical protein
VKLAGGVTGVVLGSAAALLLVAAAQAAELPSMKPAPAAPVKKCNVGGMAGVVIPGSGACVKISGYVSGGVEAGNLKP